jgi:hypothetical protein
VFICFQGDDFGFNNYTTLIIRLVLEVVHESHANAFAKVQPKGMQNITGDLSSPSSCAFTIVAETYYTFINDSLPVIV